MKIQSNRRAGTSAFSLVEVTIAMAIASVALVTLLGLIPQGMDTMREAGDMAIEARIHQQVLNELQLTPFDSTSGGSLLDTYFDGLEVYYDSQGEELSDSKSQGSAPADRKKNSTDHIYTARIAVPSATKGGTLPASVGEAKFSGYSFDGSDVNPYIRPVIVEIAAAGPIGDQFDWGKDEYQKIISTHQTVIVKMGRDYTP